MSTTSQSGTKYGLEVDRGLDRFFIRLSRRDPRTLEAVHRKILQIRERPYAFKPLRAPMQHLRRVHIGPFVMTYAVKEPDRIVRLVAFEHHDRAYR